MNYYNPYFYQIPESIQTTRTGLFSRLFKGSNLSFSKILNGTQKVLGVANQAIPLVKQVGPVINNAKAMFRIMNEFKKGDSKPRANNKQNNIVNTNNRQNNNYTNTETNTNYSSNNGPIFFM